MACCGLHCPLEISTRRDRVFRYTPQGVGPDNSAMIDEEDLETGNPESISELQPDGTTRVGLGRVGPGRAGQGLAMALTGPGLTPPPPPPLPPLQGLGSRRLPPSYSTRPGPRRRISPALPLRLLPGPPESKGAE